MQAKITKLEELNHDDALCITALSDQLGYATSIGDLAFRTTKILNSDQDCIFVARHEQQIVGWIHAFVAVRVESPLFVEIAGLVVHNDFRRQQLGKSLISAVINWSKTFEIYRIKVRCNVVRTESHQFYEKLGFSMNKQQKIFELAI